MQSGERDNPLAYLRSYYESDKWTLDSSLSDLSLSHRRGSAITVVKINYIILMVMNRGLSRMFVYDPNSDDWSQRSSMLQGKNRF